MNQERQDAVTGWARDACEDLGWPWREPARVTRTWRGYRVWTNASARDDNPWLVFDRQGRLVKSGWARRS